jgi:hypothetical protein
VSRRREPTNFPARSSGAIVYTDKREQAQEHLAPATTLYREMGMTDWLDQAEAEMRLLQ